MEELNTQYVKRTQKERIIVYPSSLQQQEIESGFITKSDAMHKYGIQGNATITRWCRKYGNFADYSLKSSSFMKTPEQRIYTL